MIRLLFLTATAFSLALGLAACADGEEAGTATRAPTKTPEAPVATHEPSPTLPFPSPAAPAETRTELEALLRSMALRLEDLPTGFTFEDEEFTMNEEAAKTYSDGEEQGLVYCL